MREPDSLWLSPTRIAGRGRFPACCTGERRDARVEKDAAWGLGFRVDDGESFGLGGIGGFAGFGIRRSGLAVGYGYVSCKLAGYERTQACEDALESVLAGC